MHWLAGAVQDRATPCKLHRLSLVVVRTRYVWGGSKIDPCQTAGCLNHKICHAQVEDPSKYGVVVTDESGKVERFVEKPKVGLFPIPLSQSDLLPVSFTERACPCC